MITDTIYRALRNIPGLQHQFRRFVNHLPHRRRTITHFGQRLIIDPSELHGFYLYYEREYDDYIFRFIQENADLYTRAIDVGANIGIYTVFLASHIAHVDAFEPDGDVLARLRSNLELNRLCNVAMHQVCVGRDCGTVPFLRADSGNQGRGRIFRGEDAMVESVSSVSLDRFFGGPVHDRTLIKVDVEGAEWLVFQGCDNSIGRRTARVDMLVENHPGDIEALGGSSAGLHQLLLKLGFIVRAITPKGLSPLARDYSDRYWWASDQTAGCN